MLQSEDIEYLKMLYNELLNLNAQIKISAEKRDFETIQTQIADKDKLIDKIISFETPRKEDIKDDFALINLRNKVVEAEKENIKYLNSVKDDTQKEMSSISKTKKIYNAYEPAVNDVQSTVDIQDIEWLFFLFKVIFLDFYS